MSFVATGLTRKDLGAGTHKLLRSNGRQILLLNAEGEIYAIANRCPHEGYPLSEGTLGPGCLLTCNWHNWKFDLKTGKAVIGRDPVPTYPFGFPRHHVYIHLPHPPA